MTTVPEYEILREKAREYKLMAEQAIEINLDAQAVQNYNFALELLMKAVLSHNGLNYPKTHNLLELSNTRDSGNVKILREAINSARLIQPLWVKIHSAWNPDQRYSLGPEDADYTDLCDAYKRVYGWINSRFF